MISKSCSVISNRQEGHVCGSPVLSSVLGGFGFPLSKLFLSPLFCLPCCSVFGAALENEILLNPKPSLVDRSVLSLIPDRLLPPDVYIDAALLRKPRAASDAGLSEAGPALRGPGPPERDSELVSGALARIRELEQEAERLEEAYRSHQHRAARASAEDLTPLRVTYRAQPRVSFTSAGRPVEQEFTRTPSPRERNPLRLLSPPARRLSSTPLSKHGADADHDAHAFTQGLSNLCLVVVH